MLRFHFLKLAVLLLFWKPSSSWRNKSVVTNYIYEEVELCLCILMWGHMLFWQLCLLYLYGCHDPKPSLTAQMWIHNWIWFPKIKMKWLPYSMIPGRLQCLLPINQTYLWPVFMAVLSSYMKKWDLNYLKPLVFKSYYFYPYLSFLWVYPNIPTSIKLEASPVLFNSW